MKLPMKHTHLLFLALSTSLLFSCKKEATSEQAAGTSNVTYQLATTNTSGGRLAGESERTMAHFLTWAGGTASVSEIKFEAKGDNKVEYKSNVPQVINLGSAVSTLGGIAVPYGTYEKIEFKIKFVPTSTNPSLELLGSYAPAGGGTPVPVVISFHEPFELKFEKKTPTTIDANTDYTALSTLALGLLSHSVVESFFANATQTNGTIVISNTSNTNLYNPLWSAFQGILNVEIKKK
jgi:hypothetical protein